MINGSRLGLYSYYKKKVIKLQSSIKEMKNLFFLSFATLPEVIVVVLGCRNIAGNG